jgi:hypothetical protein
MHFQDEFVSAREQVPLLPPIIQWCNVLSKECSENMARLKLTTGNLLSD